MSVSERHLDALGSRRGAQLGEVLDDAVVDEGDPAARARGAGGRCGRSARRGWPSGCGRCRSSTGGSGARRAPSRGWRACRRACRVTIVAAVDEGDPGGVVAAVLQAPQALDDDVLRPAWHRRTRRFRTWAGVYRQAAARPRPLRCHNRTPCPRSRRRANGRRRREPSPYVELDRAAWAAARRHGRDRRSTRRRGRPAARPRRPARPARGRAGLPPAVAPAQPLRRGQLAGCTASRRSSCTAQPAAYAVRDRGRRLGRGRQVDHRPRAAAAARPLARAPQRRAGHHRRLPATQRRARAPRASCTARASPSPTTAGRCCKFVVDVKSGTRRGRGAGLLAPRSTTSCPTSRSWSSGPTSSSSRASTCSSPRGCATTAAPAWRSATSSTSRSTSTPRLTDIARGTSTASCGCARPPSATRRRTSASTPRSPTTRPSTRPTRIWDSINEPNLVENVAPTRCRATLVLAQGRRPLRAVRPAAQALTGPTTSWRVPASRPSMTSSSVTAADDPRADERRRSICAKKSSAGHAEAEQRQPEHGRRAEADRRSAAARRRRRCRPRVVDAVDLDHEAATCSQHTSR